jgi:hypothetical protein
MGPQAERSTGTAKRRQTPAAPGPTLELALACAAGIACTACWTPSSTRPGPAPSNSISTSPGAAGCEPRTVEDLAIGEITEAAIHCLLPAATVRREDDSFFAIIPGRPGPEHIMGTLEDGLAMRVNVNEGPTVHVFAREIRTSLGIRVGSTLAELRAAVPDLLCRPTMSSQFMGCHRDPPSASPFTFWTRGSGFRPDEAYEVKLERHPDHVVAWFEYLGPHREHLRD